MTRSGKSVLSPNDLNTRLEVALSTVREDNTGPTSRLGWPLAKDYNYVYKGRPLAVSGRYVTTEANRYKVLLVRDSA